MPKFRGNGSTMTKEPMVRGLAAAALLLAGMLSSAPALAQSQSQSQGNGLSSLFGGIFSGPKPDASALQPQQGTPGTTGPLPWSGEDGASGHPLMTASAIRQAAANFNNCVAGMWPDAARRGISEDNFRRFTAGLTPDLRLMDLMDAQPEFTKSIWDYLDILVNDDRLAKGKE